MWKKIDCGLLEVLSKNLYGEPEKKNKCFNLGDSNSGPSK